MEVLKVLAAAKEPLSPGELARAARCTAGPITTLRRKGLIRSRTGALPRLRPAEAAAVREKHLVLNPDQQQALRTILDAMNARRHQTILIHGVTGSGKTEVYIQAIQEVIHFGRQAIVLVPEISLTPQTVERFRQRFGAVAVLHSHLSDAERHWHWQRIAEGAGVGGGRRPQRDLRPHAAPGADRAGRGARVVVQAGERAALSRPRRGRGPGGGRRDSAGARLGHAVAGKLASGADGPVSTGRDAAAGVGSAAAGGGHDRPARSEGRAARFRAAPSAGRCRPRWPRRWRTAGR